MLLVGNTTPSQEELKLQYSQLQSNNNLTAISSNSFNCFKPISSNTYNTKNQSKSKNLEQILLDLRTDEFGQLSARIKRPK